MILVPCFPHPRGDDRRPVVGHRLLIGGVEVGLVIAGMGYPRPHVVGYHDLGHRAHVLEGMDVGPDPRGELAGEDGFDVAVVARPRVATKR